MRRRDLALGVAALLCLGGCVKEAASPLPVAQKASAAAAVLAADLAARDDAAATPLEEHWTQFRRAFPAHVQLLALSGPVGDGTRTLVVAEPPPHVKVADVLAPLASILRRHRIQKHDAGVDLVAAVAGSEEEIAEALSALHQRLFFTGYKAYVLQLPIRGTRRRFDLELDLTEARAHEWVLDAGETFTPVEGGTAIAMSAMRGPAVYRTRRGLVAWWIPKGATAEAMRVEARQFAMDAERVLGKVSSERGTLVVGRARVVPVDGLPPPGSPRRIGWRPLREMKAIRGANRVAIERREGGYAIAIDGRARVEAYTKRDVVDAMVTSMRRDDPKRVTIELAGFDDREAIGFLRDCQAQLGAMRRTGIVAALLRACAESAAGRRIPPNAALSSP